MGERINGHAVSNWLRTIDACKYLNFCGNSFSKSSELFIWASSKNFAIARSYGSTPLKIPPYNTTWSALHKHEWSNKKVEWPNRERQMYKCHEPWQLCRPGNQILHVILHFNFAASCRCCNSNFVHLSTWSFINATKEETPGQSLRGLWPPPYRISHLRH